MGLRVQFKDRNAEGLGFKGVVWVAWVSVCGSDGELLRSFTPALFKLNTSRRPPEERPATIRFTLKRLRAPGPRAHPTWLLAKMIIRIILVILISVKNKKNNSGLIMVTMKILLSITAMTI